MPSPSLLARAATTRIVFVVLGVALLWGAILWAVNLA